MELKYQTTYNTTNTRDSFNRTFMELKSPLEKYCLKLPSVLIVPLWN